MQNKDLIGEKSIAQLSDKQANLVNKMAAKPEGLENNNDEDLKVIDVSPIKSLFCNMNLDNDGSGDESTLVKSVPMIRSFFILMQKLVTVGLKRSKLYIVMNPLFFISRNLIMIIVL